MPNYTQSRHPRNVSRARRFEDDVSGKLIAGEPLTYHVRQGWAGKSETPMTFTPAAATA